MHEYSIVCTLVLGERTYYKRVFRGVAIMSISMDVLERTCCTYMESGYV